MESKQIAPVLEVQKVESLIEKMNRALEETKATTAELSASSETIAQMDYKDVKRFEQETSKAIKTADDARKEFKRLWAEPAKAVETAYKRELVNIENLHDRYKSERVKRDNADKEQRRQALEQVYNDFIEAQEMGALFLLMPFENIMNPAWLNKSYGQKKAENELVDIIIKAISEWATLRETKLNYPEETVAKYFETLSLKDALEFDKAEKLKHEHLNELKAQVAQNAAYDPFYPAGVEVPDNSDYEPEKASERVWEVTVKPFRFKGTRQQLEEIKAFLQRVGAHGSIKEVQ